MRKFYSLALVFFFLHIFYFVDAQDYFLQKYQPYDPEIPSPEEFLGYPLGSHHTRHDQIVAYFNHLANTSAKASIQQYGKTFELRPLIIFTISHPDNMQNLQQLREKHLEVCDPGAKETDNSDLPVFIHMGYGVHGNEPSSAEAAMLTAYVMTASRKEEIMNYLDKAVIFIDPTINPDGRERHTEWVNMYKSNPLVDDPLDAEHNEGWPRGRTNHYWFDLNRDWYLAINPESRAKLNWYHQWYPNVVTDFHEMGSDNTYFFEPMKDNGSLNPIMPLENYTTLNDTFAGYFREDLDSIGSLYFTKEVFDGTYPGYGSSYPDLQGALALLFEQASSRGHVQETDYGKLTFRFTIRNQFVSSMATIRAAVQNHDMLYDYQRNFFQTALKNASRSPVKGYVFGDHYDRNRTIALLDKLLIHRIKIYRPVSDVSIDGKTFSKDHAFIVPTDQPQYRMIQSVFEIYKEYRDSVFYDASAWSLVNFYNVPHAELKEEFKTGDEITDLSKLSEIPETEPSDYAYITAWDDYNAPAFLYYLQSHDVLVTSAFKPFSISVKEAGEMNFNYGSLIIPVKKQTIGEDSLYTLIHSGSQKFNMQTYAVATGYSTSGIDLGSGNMHPLKKPKLIMLIGEGVSSYEAGEVWHLLDQRFQMPITKVQIRQFDRIDFDKYNVLVMVSGNYEALDSVKRQRVKSWVAEGNTLITIRQASEWLIKNKMVEEALVEEEKDTIPQQLPYVTARENIGKERIGGALFKVKLDLTHPLCFGYRSEEIPVYRNSTVWIQPSKNPYSTVARYSNDPLIDGFITDKNLGYMKSSASLIVSRMGSGRAVLFAENPNFRGSWYGTNRLFLNAIFLGQHIRIPE